MEVIRDDNGITSYTYSSWPDFNRKLFSSSRQQQRQQQEQEQEEEEDVLSHTILPHHLHLCQNGAHLFVIPANESATLKIVIREGRPVKKLFYSPSTSSLQEKSSLPNSVSDNSLPNKIHTSLSSLSLSSASSSLVYHGANSPISHRQLEESLAFVLYDVEVPFCLRVMKPSVAALMESLLEVKSKRVCVKKYVNNNNNNNNNNSSSNNIYRNDSTYTRMNKSESNNTTTTYSAKTFITQVKDIIEYESMFAWLHLQRTRICNISESHTPHKEFALQTYSANNSLADHVTENNTTESESNVIARNDDKTNTEASHVISYTNAHVPLLLETSRAEQNERRQEEIEDQNKSKSNELLQRLETESNAPENIFRATEIAIPLLNTAAVSDGSLLASTRSIRAVPTLTEHQSVEVHSLENKSRQSSMRNASLDKSVSVLTSSISSSLSSSSSPLLLAREVLPLEREAPIKSRTKRTHKSTTSHKHTHHKKIALHPQLVQTASSSSSALAALSTTQPLLTLVNCHEVMETAGAYYNTYSFARDEAPETNILIANHHPERNVEYTVSIISQTPLPWLLLPKVGGVIEPHSSQLLQLSLLGSEVGFFIAYLMINNNLAPNEVIYLRLSAEIFLPSSGERLFDVFAANGERVTNNSTRVVPMGELYGEDALRPYIALELVNNGNVPLEFPLSVIQPFRTEVFAVPQIHREEEEQEQEIEQSHNALHDNKNRAYFHHHSHGQRCEATTSLFEVNNRRVNNSNNSNSNSNNTANEKSEKTILLSSPTPFVAETVNSNTATVIDHANMTSNQIRQSDQDTINRSCKSDTCEETSKYKNESSTARTKHAQQQQQHEEQEEEEKKRHAGNVATTQSHESTVIWPSKASVAASHVLTVPTNVINENINYYLDAKLIVCRIQGIHTLSGQKYIVVDPKSRVRLAFVLQVSKLKLQEHYVHAEADVIFRCKQARDAIFTFKTKFTILPATFRVKREIELRQWHALNMKLSPSLLYHDTYKNEPIPNNAPNTYINKEESKEHEGSHHHHQHHNSTVTTELGESFRHMERFMDYLSDEVVRVRVYNCCSFAQSFTFRTQSPVLYVLPGYTNEEVIRHNVKEEYNDKPRKRYDLRRVEQLRKLRDTNTSPINLCAAAQIRVKPRNINYFLVCLDIERAAALFNFDQDSNKLTLREHAFVLNANNPRERVRVDFVLNEQENVNQDINLSPMSIHKYTHLGETTSKNYEREQQGQEEQQQQEQQQQQQQLVLYNSNNNSRDYNNNLLKVPIANVEGTTNIEGGVSSMPFSASSSSLSLLTTSAAATTTTTTSSSAAAAAVEVWNKQKPKSFAQITSPYTGISLVAALRPMKIAGQYLSEHFILFYAQRFTRTLNRYAERLHRTFTFFARCKEAGYPTSESLYNARTIMLPSLATTTTTTSSSIFAFTYSNQSYLREEEQQYEQRRREVEQIQQRECQGLAQSSCSSNNNNNNNNNGDESNAMCKQLHKGNIHKSRNAMRDKNTYNKNNYRRNNSSYSSSSSSSSSSIDETDSDTSYTSSDNSSFNSNTNTYTSSSNNNNGSSCESEYEDEICTAKSENQSTVRIDKMFQEAERATRNTEIREEQNGRMLTPQEKINNNIYVSTNNNNNNNNYIGKTHNDDREYSKRQNHKSNSEKSHKMSKRELQKEHITIANQNKIGLSRKG